MKKSIFKLTNFLVFIVFLFSFFLFFGSDVRAEGGTFTGTLNSTTDGYSVTDDSGKITNFTYSTDLSAHVGKTVTVSYTGTTNDFAITGISLTTGEPITGGTSNTSGNTLPKTYIFSFSKILIGLFFLIFATVIYQTRYVDFFKSLEFLIFKSQDPKGYFEEKVLNR